ncbi:hypothetical protein A3734_17935 [Sulfitobacter sp. HI0054]|uniref:HNH endonuclease n=2 Tax=unclassified Sulfitobacter TaxID=196795 RepID=UPI0007C3BEBE|nr:MULTISPECIES: HNH endonuclease [unclassified Sulfitobacter]KZY52828.1 hypothetical protein A3734_17935 [Sulfitobacter sp. HI0054]MBO9440407.1 hypothetical protein [Sulfitobacter sp. R18_2]
MSGGPMVLVRDIHEAWYEDIFEHHLEEALEKVDSLFRKAEVDENGCMVTATAQPRKVRFQGGQDRAYRFVYCVRNRLAANRDQVVRHRCHNRRCINPDHLTIGDRRDNLYDEFDRRANGVDWGAF